MAYRRPSCRLATTLSLLSLSPDLGRCSSRSELDGSAASRRPCYWLIVDVVAPLTFRSFRFPFLERFISFNFAGWLASNWPAQAERCLVTSDDGKRV